ncbi:hypothetical protein [Paraburkholderia sp. BR14320]|uniref:hypothetical protein n=1 Tax=unclassified Paraburkholderia TaxID=2615204 RepID=UPI0034CE77A1
MLEELYNRISPACCSVTVFLGDEKISEGSGFAFLPNGQVITAAHVVTGRFPIRHSDYIDPALKIFCKFQGLPVAEYAVQLCSMNIEVPGFSQPVQLDIAMLNPKEPFPTEVPRIPVVLGDTPRLGQRVFLAGYSEELRLSVLGLHENEENDGVEGLLALRDDSLLHDVVLVIAPIIRVKSISSLVNAGDAHSPASLERDAESSCWTSASLRVRSSDNSFSSFFDFSTVSR